MVMLCTGRFTQNLNRKSYYQHSEKTTPSLLSIFPPVSPSQLLLVHCPASGVAFPVPSGASDIFPGKALSTLNEQSFQHNPHAQQCFT